jgi:PAS domain S-box-containing protein
MGSAPARKRISASLVGRAIARSTMAVLLLERAAHGARIVFASDGFEHLTGWQARDVYGRDLRLLEGRETGCEEQQELARALASERESRVVARHHRRDGRPFWNELLLSPIWSPSGEATHLLCVQSDVTRQIEAERALSRTLQVVACAKQEWEAAADSLHELVLLVNARGRVIRANRAVDAWRLASVKTVPGRDMHELLHRSCSSDPCYLLELWRRLATDPDRPAALEANASDEVLGRRVHVSMRATRIADPELPFASATVVVRDVSASWEAQEARLRSERFEALGRVAAGLAHELCNPIAAMKTTLEVWQRGYDVFDEPAHRRYLARLGEGVDRLQATLDRILGRPRPGPSDLEALVVAPLVERTARLYEDLAQARGVGIACAVADAAGLRMLADPAAVDEVLANVIKNAIEACTPGGAVAIDARADGGSVLIRVRDDGRGIPREAMRRLFAPFFTTKPTGTGLGLAHANHLMEGMGGRICVESGEGRGTLVSLRFRAVPVTGAGGESWTS